MRRHATVLLAALLASAGLAGIPAGADAPRPSNDLEIDTAGLDLAVDGVQADGNLGGNESGYAAAVNHVGDVNGDGIDDVVVGEGGTASGETSAWVLFGPVTTAPDLTADLGDAGFRISSDVEGFGRNAVAAGDVNGDGIDDVLVGGRVGSNQSSFAVVYGSSSVDDVELTALGARGFRLTTADDSVVSAASVGDFDGDGYDDVAFARGPAGDRTVRVVFGAPGRTHDVDLEALGDEGLEVGEAGVRLASGDVNGDGHPDLVTLGSSVVVVFGGGGRGDVDTADLGDRGFRIMADPPPSTGDRLVSQRIGVSIAVGDLDGDGIDDIAFPVSRTETTLSPYESVLQEWVVIAHSSTETTDRHVDDPGFAGYRIANDAGRNFANSLASDGDVDRDGYEDLLIGSPGNSGATGRADLVYGTARDVAADIDLATAPPEVALGLTTAPANDSFARSVAFVDLDASGRRDDLAFGAPAEDPGGLADAGSVRFVRDLVPDTTAPTVEVTVVSRTADPTPEVTFESPDSDVAGFVCLVDEGPESPCTSPWTPETSLAHGERVVEVRATDTSGNVGTGTASVEIDLEGPPATIDEIPTGVVRQDTVTVAFSSTDPDGDLTGFVCAVDGGAPYPCTSPTEVGPLSDGDHVVAVAAVDDLGNVGEPAEAALTVDVPANGIPARGDGAVDAREVVDGRIAGRDRIGTSVRLARMAWTTADAAVLARADDYADALAATTLGAALDAPILQTHSTSLDPRVADELTRLGVATVYLAGGPTALSGDVADALRGLGLDVVRLADDTRFGTAAEVADRLVGLTGAVDRVVVTLGSDPEPGRPGWVDALAAGGYAITTNAPVLLTERDALPSQTSAAIERLLPVGGDVVVVGGPAAVSDEVEAALAGLSGTIRVTRLSGDTRYDTTRRVLDAAVVAGGPQEVAFAASGENYPDALSGAVAAWKVGGFLTLVSPRDLAESVATRDHLVANADEITRAIVVGGLDAVDELVGRQVRAAVDGGPVPAR